MKLTKFQEYIGALLVFSSFLSTLGNPLSGLGGEEAEFPFENCDKYYLGGEKGLPIIKEKSLKLEPVFAIYPMTDEPIALAFHVMFPEAVLKITIQGTMIAITKCSKRNRECIMENEEGVKHVDYIKAHQWNKVRLNMKSNKMEIYIGERKVLSKPLEGYSMNLDEIYWRIISNEQRRKGSKTSEPDFLYLVQFQCPDSSNLPELENKSTYHPFFDDFTSTYEFTTMTPYDDHKPASMKPYDDHRPASMKPYDDHKPASMKPHDDHKPPSKPYFPRNEVNTHTEGHFIQPVTEYTTSEKPYFEHATDEEHKESSEGGDYIGLIVGLVIAAIILITLFIVIYNVIKKRRSMSLTETSPLSPDQKQQETKN